MDTTMENPSQAYRKIAVIVSVLYIIGTVAGILNVILMQPIVNAPDYLAAVTANENRLITGSS